MVYDASKASCDIYTVSLAIPPEIVKLLPPTGTVGSLSIENTVLLRVVLLVLLVFPTLAVLLVLLFPTWEKEGKIMFTSQIV